MKANCINCHNKQPNLTAAPKKPNEWQWPDDWECAAGIELFPGSAYVCDLFIHEDDFKKEDSDD